MTSERYDSDRRPFPLAGLSMIVLLVALMWAVGSTVHRLTAEATTSANQHLTATVRK
jgi:hypothetical protein